jgi:hypothetical protein
VAAKLTKFFGRRISHVRVSPEEAVKVYMNAWFPEPAARFMSFLEASTAKGAEGVLQSDAVKMVSGHSGQSFDEFLREATW